MTTIEGVTEMADDKELEDEGGKILPLRQMMSLISTDPADAMHSTIVPPGASDPQPVSGEGPPLATLPVEPPDTEAAS